MLSANTLSLSRRLGECKNFTHVTRPYISEISAVTGEDGTRLYTTPMGTFPSVTTILGDLKKKSIKEWRERVGDEEADAISGRASVRGNFIHSLCEYYIDNRIDEFTEKVSPYDITSFKDIKTILDIHVNNVRVQEVGLFSAYLQAAGRVDLVAEYDGRLSIIDFKTSRKPKKKEWIDNYFMQAAAYAVMWEELTQVPIQQTVIIILVDHHEPQVFVEKRDNYIFQFVKARKAYKEKYNV